MKLNIKDTLIYFLIVLFITFAIMESSFGLFPIGFLAALLIFILSLIVLIIVGLIDWRKKTSFNKPFLIFSLLILASLLSFFGIAKFQYKISDKRADKIIISLNDYYELKGEYPTKLVELNDEQLISVPTTGLGLGFRKFEYISKTNGKYWLKYDSYFGVTNWYNSETDSWHSDD